MRTFVKRLNLNLKPHRLLLIGTRGQSSILFWGCLPGHSRSQSKQKILQNTRKRTAKAQQGQNWQLKVGSWRQVGGSKVKEQCSWTPSHPLCWGVRWGLTAARTNVGSGWRCTSAGGQRGGGAVCGQCCIKLEGSGVQWWKEWYDLTIGARESLRTESVEDRMSQIRASVSLR